MIMPVDCDFDFFYLLEADVVSVFSEALTAQVDTVFADQTVVIGTGTTENRR